MRGPVVGTKDIENHYNYMYNTFYLFPYVQSLQLAGQGFHHLLFLAPVFFSGNTGADLACHQDEK